MVGDRIQIETFANQFEYEHNLRKEREYKERKTLIMPSVDGSYYCKLRACQSPTIQAPDSYSVHGSPLSQGRGYYHPVTRNYKEDQETAGGTNVPRPKRTKSLVSGRLRARKSKKGKQGQPESHYRFGFDIWGGVR